MLGAIAGDVIGSVYEWCNHRSKDFDLFRPDRFFTDDTVLTVATAEALLHGSRDLAAVYRKYTRCYPGRGYGGRYAEWAHSEGAGPYNSFGNGSAMRVSPVGWVANSLEEALSLAAWTAGVTHNHPEGVKGAQATAGAVFLARTGSSKEQLREFICSRFGYRLDFTIDQVRPTYAFDETCQGTVPHALVAFLESGDFEDAIRTAVSVGGDTDTLACITGGVAEAFYGGVPAPIGAHVIGALEPELAATLGEFRSRFCGE